MDLKQICEAYKGFNALSVSARRSVGYAALLAVPIAAFQFCKVSIEGPYQALAVCFMSFAIGYLLQAVVKAVRKIAKKLLDLWRKEPNPNSPWSQP